VQEGRRSGRVPAGGRVRGQADVAADTTLPPGPYGRRSSGRPTGRRPPAGPHNGHSRQYRSHWCRDGMPDGLCSGCANRVRYVQSCESRHGH